MPRPKAMKCFDRANTLARRCLGDPRGLGEVLHFVQDDDMSYMACRQAHLKESSNGIDGEREDDDVERK
jgi:hypothetical protein